MNECDVEEARCTLLELQAVEFSEQAKAEAEAQGQRLEKSKRGTLFFIDHLQDQYYCSLVIVNH